MYIGCCEKCVQDTIKKDNKANREDRVRNIEMHMVRVGVSKKYLKCSLNNFKNGNTYAKFAEQYLKKPTESMFITGPFGSGKTHIAVSICRELMLADKKPSMRFITASELLLKIRSTFSQNGPDEEQVISKYTNLDYLFIDDIGAEKTTDWARATFYLIIDRRDRDMKPTIITSNLTLKEIASTIDGRIASRISNGAIMKINMPDYRAKRQGEK